MNNLILFKSEKFENTTCDFWSNNNDDIFMSIIQLAEVLGYSSKSGIENILNRNEYLKNNEFSSTHKLNVVEGNREVSRKTRVFTEDGIYEVTLLAKTEKAKQFRKWVRDVLKGLRKGELKLTQQFNLPITYKEALVQLLTTIEKNEKLEEQNKVLIPKAEGYDILIDAHNFQNFGEVAKCFGIGRNSLYSLLRREKILMNNNVPYQKYLNNDYFLVKEVSILRGQYYFNGTQTFIKPKGLDFLKNLLKEKGFCVNSLALNKNNVAI